MATDYDFIVRKGNLGVGTKSPGGKVTIATPSAYDGTVLRLQSTAEPDAYNFYVNETVTSGVVRWAFNMSNNGTYSNMMVFDRGNVGIGTTDPSSLLNIVSSTQNAAALVVQDNARKVKIGRDQLEATDLSDIAATMYLQPNSNLAINTSAGNTGIGSQPISGYKLTVAGAITGSSINFGQTNLNFYEEGTWTPALNTTNNNLGTVNYNGEPVGVYTRIGNVVHAWFDIDVNDISLGANTGTGTIDDLPYTSNSDIGVFSSLVITEGDLLGAGAAGTQVKGYVVGGEDRITIDYYDSGTNGFGVNGRSLFNAVSGGILSGYITYQV